MLAVFLALLGLTGLAGAGGSLNPVSQPKASPLAAPDSADEPLQNDDHAMGDDSVAHDDDHAMGDDSVAHDDDHAMGDDSVAHDDDHAMGDDSVAHDDDHAMGDDSVAHDDDHAMGDDSVAHDDDHAMGDDSVAHDDDHAMGDDSVAHDDDHAMGDDSVAHDDDHAMGDDSVAHDDDHAMGDDSVAHDDDHAMGDDSVAHDDDHAMGDDSVAHDDDHAMGDDSVAHDDDHAMGDDSVAHDDDHAMGDDSVAHDDDHAMGDDSVAHDDDHANHTTPLTLPTTPEEIAAFVAAVKASPDTHSHDADSPMADEHMAAMDLVPRDEATHIAIGHGAWDDPANWHNGEVPGDNATVLIPEGVHMDYDHVSEARVLTVRVDGHLEFATDVDSKLIVDTMVVSPSGTLTIGTETNPVDPSVDVNIIFANNGAINTDWDPMLLSRGMISHGEVEIHGAEKDSHEKVIDDPMAGDTWVDFGETPEGWAVGDTIVIAGTRYEGYKWGRKEDGTDGIRHYESEDEVRTITEIADGQVFFDEPLLFDHATPRMDLKTSVANYTRNVSFETEDADLAEVHERGHVMFMHTDDVDVRYAEFSELGRTDKSETALNVGEFESVEFDTNVKGRYSFHLHRAGVDDPEDPAMAVGNAVYGSPGWGFVHHDSNAILDNNATFNTFGAGYVAESGNETGEWTNNIAIYAKGNNWNSTKLGNDLANFDLGQSGDGFWFQGRLISSVDNVAASVNHGFVYFHRGREGEDGMILSDADDFALPSVLTYDDTVRTNATPILSFSGNETFASRVGLEVVKANPRQDHDVHSKLEDFTAWNVKYGAFLEYTAHYTLEDFDLIGKESTSFNNVQTGILFGTNTPDMTIVNSTISGFQTGIKLNKSVTTNNETLEHGYNVIDVTITDTDQDYASYDPDSDLVATSADLPVYEPDVDFDAPLRLLDSPDPDTRGVFINGTKTDSLGETGFPGEWESFKLETDEAARLLEANGYYSTTDGEEYFVLDVFFSDRLTGDIYLEKHPVFIDENVPLGSEFYAYSGAEYNGVRDLDDSEEDPTFDAAVLWATLTDGQVTLTDDALALEEAEKAWAEAAALEADQM